MGCTGAPELLWVGWAWLSHPAPKLWPRRNRGTHHPRGMDWPPHGAAGVLQSSWAAKPARKASGGELLYISPCCSPAFQSSLSGSPRSCRFVLGQQRQGQGCARSSSGWEGGFGRVPSSPGSSPIHPRAQLGGPAGSREWASAGSGQAGNCKSFSVRRWAGAPACLLFPAKASAVLRTALPPSLLHFRPGKCLMGSPQAQLPLVGFSVVG